MNENTLANGKSRLILASNSPRRRELLAGLGYPYEVRVLKGIDESSPETLCGSEVAAHISRKKAEAYRATMAADEIIITADTIVCLDDKVLGKPADEADARATLFALSGQIHQVMTGVTVLKGESSESFTEITDVFFRPLSGRTPDIDGTLPKKHHILIPCTEMCRESDIFQKFQVFIDTFCNVMVY